MSARAIVIGDSSNHGGSVISASGTAMTDKGPMVLEGDYHSCPIKGHSVTPISTNRYGPVCNGRAILFTGAIAGCGAVITGSASVVQA